MKLRFLISALLIWQVIISAGTWLSVRNLPLRDKFFGGMELAGPLDPNPFLRNPILYARANFDGVHYVNLAKGSSFGLSQEVFFPFYIKLLSLLGPVFKNYNSAGVFISLASFAAGSYILLRLLQLDFSWPVVKWTYLALLLFPTAFYFSFVYTEGLFFFLSVACFYFARTGRWWLAGLVGALACYTRITGILLFPALLIEYFSAPARKFSSLLAVCLVPVGLAVFMLQLSHTFHDPLAFIHAQSDFFQGRTDHLVLLPQVFWRYLKIFLSFNPSDPLLFTLLLEFFTALVFLVLNLLSLFRLRFSYIFFSFAAFLLPPLTGSFTSLPRYVLAGFPVFILLGSSLSRARTVNRVIYISLSLFLGLFFLSLFVRGYWVS